METENLLEPHVTVPDGRERATGGRTKPKATDATDATASSTRDTNIFGWRGEDLVAKNGLSSTL